MYAGVIANPAIAINYRICSHQHVIPYLGVLPDEDVVTSFEIPTCFHTRIYYASGADERIFTYIKHAILSVAQNHVIPHNRASAQVYFAM